MSEIVLPEPYYNGNIRTVAGDLSSRTRPKTVPASLLGTKNEAGSLYRPASGCRRLSEITDSLRPSTNKLPVSHRLQRMKDKRPSSPMEVVSEKPGVKIMKSKGSFLAEVNYDAKEPVEAQKKLSTSGVLRKEIEEDLAISGGGGGGAVSEFKKIAKLQSDNETAILIAELKQQLKVKEAELGVKEKVIAQMQEQVDDFQLQLGEERLNHQDTKKMYDQRLITLRDRKDAEREAAVRDLSENYEAKINETNAAHAEEVSDMKSLHARVQKKLEDQVEHLENAFDEFRVSFTSEMELKWKRREEEVRKKIQDEADSRWHSIVTKNNEKHKEEVELLKKKQTEEIEVIKHEHESEVNSLLRKYKDAYSLSEKVARQQQLIEGLHERLREFEAKVEDTTHQLADKTREAAEMTMRLTTMERDFSTKLQQNADMWQRRLEGYIAENADIKRLYAFSVHRQSCDRLERDIEMRDRSRRAAQLANAKLKFREKMVEAVLHSRIRTGLPLVPSNPPTEDEERRVRQAQLLRQRAAKLGAAAIVEATDLFSGLPPTDGTEKPQEELPGGSDKAAAEIFPATAGRPMSAPTTDVENFCVFMSAAAAIQTSDQQKGSMLPAVVDKKRTDEHDVKSIRSARQKASAKEKK